MLWQNVIIAAIVVAAGVYLALSYVKRKRNKITCSACLATRNIKRTKEPGPHVHSSGR